MFWGGISFLITAFMLNAACGRQQRVVNREGTLRDLIVNLFIRIIYCLIVSFCSFFVCLFKERWILHLLSSTLVLG